MTSEVDVELELLRTFANTSLRKGSFIYEKVHDLLSQADREKARLAVMAASSTPSDSITLRVRINITGFNDIRTLEVKKGSSLESLKRSIDKVTGNGYSTERVLLKRTGKAWGTFDSKSIEQCEMKNNDEIIVDCKNLNENLNPTGLERIPASGLVPQSCFQFLSLAFHAFMLDEGFISVAELPNAMPGFAPSLKELPKGTFLPNNWNTNAAAVSIIYKHKSKPGKLFQMMMVEIDSATMMITLTQKAGETHTREVSVTAHEPTFVAYTTRTAGSVEDQTGVEILRESTLWPLIKAVLPDLPLSAKATKQTADSVSSASSGTSASTLVGMGMGQGASSGANGGAGTGAYLPYPPGPSGGPQPGYPTPSFGGASGAGVGSGDLDPFPGGVHIGGSGSGGFGGGGSGAFGPNGGNLVGPNHPMFDPNGGFGSGGGYGGEFGGYGPSGGYNGLPQPRFDPFGPVLGPNTDIGGGGVGNVGVDGRGRPIPGMFPGRFPGRGSAGRGAGTGRGVPGEPQPDHLRPPGW